MFLEYESVLKRDGMLGSLSMREIDDILNYLLSKSRQRAIYFLWRPFLKDPKDDLVLELAVESRCSHIITFNKKDFYGVEKFGLSVVTPQEFMIEKGMLP